VSTPSVTLAVDVDAERLPLPPDELEALFARALTACGYAGAVSLAVVDDETMRAVNRDYHDTDAATDVLAFPLGDAVAPGAFTAEIVVSLDTAVREAQTRGVTCVSELLLYVVHGTLHMLGYDDHEADEARRMHARTLEILTDLGYENRIEVEE
jgi:probable rRNA maturation factor